MQISKRMAEIPRIGLDIMGDQADVLPGEPYRLENADSDIPPPEWVVDATQSAVGRDEYNSWLPLTGLRELRQAVVELAMREHDLDYDWQTEALITNGVQEGLMSVLLTLIEPGDGVITTEPAYSGIINRIRLAHGRPQFVPLSEEHGWHFDLGDLEDRVMEHTKGIVFNATNMPTGVVHSKDEIDAFAEIARRHDLWVVYSATSSRTVLGDTQVHHIATWPEMRERTVVVDGVSKDFNLTAWRIGWVLAAESLVEPIARAHVYNGTLTGGYQQAGVIALLNDEPRMQADLEMRKEELKRRRDVVVEGINAIPGLSCVEPDGGWWLLVDHRDLEGNDAKFAQYLLDEVNVAVTPMGTWGPSTSTGHIRIIYSNEPVNRLQAAVDLIGRAVEKLKVG